MGIASAAWCVVCGELPEIAMSYERNGTMAHYGACRAHAHQVVDRVFADLGRIDRQSHPSVHKVAGYIDISHEADDSSHPLRQLEP